MLQPKEGKKLVIANGGDGVLIVAPIAAVAAPLVFLRVHPLHVGAGSIALEDGCQPFESIEADHLFSRPSQRIVGESTRLVTVDNSTDLTLVSYCEWPGFPPVTTVKISESNLKANLRWISVWVAGRQVAIGDRLIARVSRSSKIRRICKVVAIDRNVMVVEWRSSASKRSQARLRGVSVFGRLFYTKNQVFLE